MSGRQGSVSRYAESFEPLKEFGGDPEKKRPHGRKTGIRACAFHTADVTNEDSEGSMSGDLLGTSDSSFLSYDSLSSIGSAFDKRVQRRHTVTSADEEDSSNDSQDGKLSEGGRRALRRRRLQGLSQRDRPGSRSPAPSNRRSKGAKKIQAFVRGCLCRQRVSLMVAELIDQLQAQLVVPETGQASSTERSHETNHPTGERNTSNQNLATKNQSVTDNNNSARVQVKETLNSSKHMPQQVVLGASEMSIVPSNEIAQVGKLLVEAQVVDGVHSCPSSKFESRARGKVTTSIASRSEPVGRSSVTVLAQKFGVSLGENEHGSTPKLPVSSNSMKESRKTSNEGKDTVKRWKKKIKEEVKSPHCASTTLSRAVERRTGHQSNARFSGINRSVEREAASITKPNPETSDSSQHSFEDGKGSKAVGDIGVSHSHKPSGGTEVIGGHHFPSSLPFESSIYLGNESGKVQVSTNTKDRAVIFEKKKSNPRPTWAGVAKEATEVKRSSVLEKAQRFTNSSLPATSTSKSNTEAPKRERPELWDEPAPVLSPAVAHSPTSGIKPGRDQNLHHQVGADQTSTGMQSRLVEGSENIRNSESKAHHSPVQKTLSSPSPMSELHRTLEPMSVSPGERSIEKLNKHPQRSSLGIQDRISQLEAEKTAQPPSIPFSADVDVSIDVVAQQCLMHLSATKIQALSRGYLYRKRDIEATLNVVQWVKQNQELKLLVERAGGTSGKKNKRTGVPSFPRPLMTSTSDDVRLSNKNSENNPLEKRFASFPSIKRILLEDGSADRAAVKLQALARGWLARKVDYGGMRYAIEWLEQNKLLKATENEESDTESIDLAVSADVAKSFASRQLERYNAVLKIQSCSRGYLQRKFDMKATDRVISWLKEYQQLRTPVGTKGVAQDVEPNEKQLQSAWVFLESNNDELEDQTSSDGDDSGRNKSKVNVTELLNTWEWLKAAETREGRNPELPSAIRGKAIESRSPVHGSKRGAQLPKSSELGRLHAWIDERGLGRNMSGKHSFEEIRPFLSAQAAKGKGTDDRLSTLSNRKVGLIAARFRPDIGGEETKGQGLRPSEPKNFGEMNELWTWLEQNNVDMSQFRDTADLKFDRGTPLVDLAKPRSPEAVGDNKGGNPHLHAQNRLAKNVETGTPPGSIIIGDNRGFRKVNDKKSDRNLVLRPTMKLRDDAKGNFKSGSSVRNQNVFQYGVENVDHKGSHHRHDGEEEKGVGFEYIDGDLSGAYKGGKRLNDKEEKGVGFEYIGEDFSGAYTGGRGLQRRYDDDEKKGAGFEYINEDLSGAYKGGKPPQPGYDDDEKTGAGFEYINEDLSGAYTGGKPPHRRYDDDEKKGTGFEYINEDLSGAYKGGKAPKPSYDDDEKKGVGFEYINEDLSGAYKGGKGPGYDDDEKKGTGFEYINDDLSGAYKGGKSPQSGYDDDEKNGAGFEYINDDLSGAYKGNKPPQRGYDDDEKKGTGFEYIDEDLSGAYKGGKTPQRRYDDDEKKGAGFEYINEDGSNQFKKQPTMTAMISYWNFSNHYGTLTDLVEDKRNDESSGGADREGGSPVESTLDSSRPRHKTAQKSMGWKESASENPMLSTLSWLQNQGIALDTVKTSHTPAVTTSVPEEPPSKSESVAKNPSKTDLQSTLDWLMKQGYGFPRHDPKEKPSREEGASRDMQRGPVEPNLDIDILGDREGPPSSSDMRDALCWLQQKDYPSSKPTLDAKADQSKKPTTDVLYSLSWLQKNGLNLDSHGKQADESSTTTVSDSVDGPTMKEMLSALRCLDKKTSDKKKDTENPEHVDESMPTTNAEVDDLKSTVKWLTDRGVGCPDTTPEAKSSSDSDGHSRAQSSPSKQSGLEMSNALSWLQKKGINLTKGKKPDNAMKRSESEIPSARDAEAAIESLKAKPAGEQAPSPEEMKAALSWLKLRDGRRKQAKKMSGIDKNVSEVDVACSVVQQMREANNRVGVEKNKENSNVLSWKVKWAAAKKKLLGLDGEVRPEWLQRRLDIINRPGKKSADISKPPSAKDMENALLWFDRQKVKKKQTEGVRGARTTAVDQVGQSLTPQAAKSSGTTRSDQQKTGDVAVPPSQIEMNRALQYLQKVDKHTSNTEDKKSVLSKDMEKTLKWLQNKASGPKEIVSKKTRQEGGTVTAKKKHAAKDKAMVSQSAVDYRNALRWLENKTDDSIQDSSYFRKLDALLPKKDLQTTEARAKEMAKAMKWVKKQGILNPNSGNKANDADSPISAPRHQLGLVNNNSKLMDEDGTLPSPSQKHKQFSKSKPSKSPKSLSRPGKAKDKSLSPRRANKGAVPKSVFDRMGKLSAGNTVPVTLKSAKPTVDTTQSNESTDLSNALAWLTNNKSDSVQDSNYFQKLDLMLPRKPGQSTEQRAKAMAKALQWVRKTSNTKADKGTVVNNDGEKRSGQEKRKAASGEGPKQARQNALVRKTSNTKADKGTVVSNEGEKRIAQETSKTASGDGPKQARQNVLVTEDFQKEKNTKRWSKLKSNIPSLVLDSDAEKALAWLRQGTGDDEDRANFKKLDTMLPKKAGQGAEERAVEMAKALKFLRKKGMGIRLKDSNDEKSSTKQNIKQQDHTDVDETRSRELDNALAYVKLKSEGGDVSQLEDSFAMKKVDNMLPRKADQTTEERAHEIVKMRTWLRKKGKII